MNFSIDNYKYLLLLLVLPLVIYFLFQFIDWKKSRKYLFAEEKFHQELFRKSSWFSIIFPFLYILAFLFLILAMVDFISGKEEIKVQQKINSVIFVLDVSNSMNAQDINPSRLEQAKNIMINTIHQLKSDKVGLIVFAGESQSIMPLTTDYSAAETYINGLETSVISRQGTDFLRAIKTATEKFKNIPKGARKIVLISDGEDNEGNEKSALKEAQNEGIIINSVGIGNEEGAPIPVYVYGQFVGYKTDEINETIITKRETEALMTLAYDSGGDYIDGNDLQTAVNKLIMTLSNQKGNMQTVVNSQSSVHYYQWFLSASLVLFFLIFVFNPYKDFNI